MSDKNKTTETDFPILLLFAFTSGIGVGLFVALFFIPNAQRYDTFLKVSEQERREMKMQLAAYRATQERHDWHLKWIDSRLDNHTSRLKDLESLVAEEEPEAAPEPLKFGQVK